MLLFQSEKERIQVQAVGSRCHASAATYVVRRLAFPAPFQWYGLVWGGGGGNEGAWGAAGGHREGRDLSQNPSVLLT